VGRKNVAPNGPQRLRCQAPIAPIGMAGIAVFLGDATCCPRPLQMPASTWWEEAWPSTTSTGVTCLTTTAVCRRSPERCSSSRPGCRLPIVDLLYIRHYADHLHDLRMQDMRYRRLGWRMW
jgi:hypothetical protein